MATWGGFDYANIIANRQKDTFIHGFLDVSGNTIITNGDVSIINGNLIANYDASINGNVIINKTLTTNGNLIANYDASINGNVIINKTLTTNGNLIANYDASINGNVIINKTLTTNGNLYINYDASINGNLVVNKNITINGNLSVKQYQAQSVINTTTTNYQLIVSEDISLNGRLFTSGNVGIGTGTPAVALDVIGNVRCTKGYDLNYSVVPTYTANQIGYTTFVKPTINNSLAGSSSTTPFYITSIQIPSAGVWNIMGVLGLANAPSSATGFGLLLYSATSVGSVNTTSAAAGTAISTAAPSAVKLMTNMSYIQTGYLNLGMQIQYIYTGASTYIILGAFSGAGGQNDYGTGSASQLIITRIA